MTTPANAKTWWRMILFMPRSEGCRWWSGIINSAPQSTQTCKAQPKTPFFICLCLLLRPSVIWRKNRETLNKWCAAPFFPSIELGIHHQLQILKYLSCCEPWLICLLRRLLECFETAAWPINEEEFGSSTYLIYFMLTPAGCSVEMGDDQIFVNDKARRNVYKLHQQ